MNILSFLRALEKLEFKGLSGDTAQILIVLINELTRGVVDVAALEFASTFKTWTTRVAKSISLMSVVGIKEPYLSLIYVPIQRSTSAGSSDMMAVPDQFRSG